jgi:hypothetical protein
MISAENYRQVYNGNGATTQFNYLFPLTNKAHILVTLTDANDAETTLTVDVDYTVNGVNDSNSANWYITTIGSHSPIAAGERLTIVPNLPLTQLTNFTTLGGFFPETHEDRFDYAMLVAQQMQEKIDRAVKVSVGSLNDPDTIIADLQAQSAAATAAASAAGAAQTAAEAAQTAAETAATNAALYPIPPWATATAYIVNQQVHQSDKIYRCAIAHTSGTFATDLSGGNWVELGGAGTPAYIKETITQSSHGFVAGDVLKFVSGSWAKAQAKSAANSEALGIVESSVDANNFVLVYSGAITLSGLTQNSEYFLSAVTAGATTTTAPSTLGQIVRSLFMAISTTKAIIRIQNPGVQVV